MPDICFSATRPARFSKWSGAAMLALKCLVLPWTLSNQAIPDHPTWYRFQESWVFGPDAQPPQLQPKCKLIWINSAYWKDSIQRNIKCSGWICLRSLCIEWFARCATLILLFLFVFRQETKVASPTLHLSRNRRGGPPRRA